LEPGSRYAVDVSVDLVHWTELSSESALPERAVEVQQSESTKFFRLRVETP
jgi:hypothetical protein